MNSYNEIDVFNRSTQKAYDWLNLLREKFDYYDQQEAYNVLRAVLHALRDRLPAAGLGSLSSQLPIVLRGVLFDGWSPTAEQKKWKTDEFFAAVEKQISVRHHLDGRTATQAVVWLLREEIGDNTVAKILGFLPADLRKEADPGSGMLVETFGKSVEQPSGGYS